MSCEGLKISIDPNKICPDCFSNSTVATENGKRFSILKPAHIPVCKAHIDGCLIKSQQVRKCDFFFEVSTNPKRYFLVELKGVDLDTAVSQLSSTYDQLNATLQAAPEQFTAVVVSSAVPARADAKFRNAQEKLRRSKGLKLDRRTKHYEITISA